jgi:hypothetical protein
MGPPLPRGERCDCYFHSPSAGGDPSGRSLTGESQSQSYVTIDDQAVCLSVCLSWCLAPIWGPRPDFYYCQTDAGLLMWGARSDKKTGLSFTIAVALASAVILGSAPRGTHDMEGQIPVFIFPRNRVAQLHPQALGSLFVAFYDSQGYCGGIRIRLHAGITYGGFSL